MVLPQDSEVNFDCFRVDRNPFHFAYRFLRGDLLAYADPGSFLMLACHDHDVHLYFLRFEIQDLVLRDHSRNLL